MATYSYVLIPQDPHAAVLGTLQNVDKDYQLLEDVSRAEGFPADAFFDMQPDFGMQLRDFVANGNGLLVVSEAVRAFLESQDDVKDVELLPVTIVDHKGRPVEDAYYILQLLGFQDAIDREKSRGRMWASNPEDYRRIFDLVLDEERMDPEKAMFRLSHYPYPVIVRQDLVARIEEAGLTGIRFDPVEDFDPFAIL